MHEINIVRQVLKTVGDFAGENGITEVSEIVLDIGELSLIIPEYIEEIYPAVAQGTMFENTKLIMNTIPGLAQCAACDEIFNVIEYNGYCPNCGGFEKTVLTGKDFSIREIHIPEDED